MEEQQQITENMYNKQKRYGNKIINARIKKQFMMKGNMIKEKGM
jgi:hypothetical protein